MDEKISKRSDVAVVGFNDVLETFQMIGIDVYVVSKDKEEVSFINDLSGKGYKILFIEEEFAKKVYDVLKDILYNTDIAVYILPPVKEKAKLGDAFINEALKRGLGIDVSIDG